MKIGAAVVKIDKWTIFKTVDLGSIRIQVENNLREYSRLKGIIYNHSELRRELVGINLHIETFIELTRDRLHQILPSNRIKRGILNPLGSLIKIISGNLDNNDAIQYNEEISKLKHKEHLIERKTSLMQKAFDKLVNISDTINFNVNHLHHKTSQIETLIQNENKLSNSVPVLNSIYQILNNFRTIYSVIQDLESAIAFSKLHTLHHSIINSTELFNILKTINYHEQLLYPVTMDNLVKLERNIIVKSFINNSILVFILEIPLIDENTYMYYKIIPIPIFNPLKNTTLIIIPQYPYLLVNRLKYKSLRSPCEQIEGDRFLCYEDAVEQYPGETCIEQLMQLKNNYTACKQTTVQIEETRILRIFEETWLLYSQKDTTITESCHTEIHKQILRGTFIITPSPGCEVQLGTVIIKPPTNMTLTKLSTPPVPLPELKKTDQGEKQQQKDLRGVDFSEVKDILTATASDYQPDHINYIISDRISLGTLILYVCLIIGIIIFISVKIYSKLLKQNFLKASSSPSDNSSLGEGGVKGSEPTLFRFISKPKQVTAESAE
jgi:hypothetical protein